MTFSKFNVPVFFSLGFQKVVKAEIGKVNPTMVDSHVFENWYDIWNPYFLINLDTNTVVICYQVSCYIQKL